MTLDAFHLHPWQTPGYIEDNGGHMHMDGVDLVELAGVHGTPLVVYSARRLNATAAGIKDAFRAIHPNTTVAFASKACSLIGVIRLFEANGLAIEVNSAGELMKARLAGFPNERIVLNGVAKSESELFEAMDPPIKSINADSVFEVERIARVAADRGTRANVSFRLVPEIESGTSPGIETASSATKFGMTQPDLKAALAVVKQNPEGIRLVGIHVHIGSQVTNRDSYAKAGRFIAEQALKIESELGSPLSLVNVGGGFPVDYVKYHDQSPEIGYYRSELSPADIAEAVLGPVREGLGNDIEIVIEPGRRMMAESGVLLGRVENRKSRGEENWLYLDAGYHTLLESFVCRWYFHMVTATRTADRETGLFRMVGPLCDSADSFFDVEGETMVRRLLSETPELAGHRETLERNLIHLPRYRELAAETGPGDLVAFLDTGAYVMDQVFALNGRGRPAVVMIDDDGSVRTIRQADSREDLMLNEVY